jgi:F0F1-type ATP synthase assembly protein I
VRRPGLLLAVYLRQSCFINAVFKVIQDLTGYWPFVGNHGQPNKQAQRCLVFSSQRSLQKEWLEHCENCFDHLYSASSKNRPFVNLFMTERSANIELKSKPSLVVTLAFLQMLGAVVFSLVLYFYFDAREALSGLFGGLIAAAASLFFAGRLFATAHSAPAQEILFRFYFSVAFKVVFTLAMMAICIIVMKVSILPFIIGYFIAAVIINWLFLLVSET